MQCVLVRHGEAGWDAPSDEQRALTLVGEHHVTLAANWLADQWQPDLLIHSPFIRARQTADVFLSRYPGLQRRQSDSLQPEVTLAELEALMLSANAERLLLVGHNPQLSRALRWFCGEDINEVMAPASMALIDTPVIAQHTGRLQWLRHAPEYEQIARRQ